MCYFVWWLKETEVPFVFWWAQARKHAIPLTSTLIVLRVCVCLCLCSIPGIFFNRLKDFHTKINVFASIFFFFSSAIHSIMPCTSHPHLRWDWNDKIACGLSFITLAVVSRSMCRYDLIKRSCLWWQPNKIYLQIVSSSAQEMGKSEKKVNKRWIKTKRKQKRY